MTQLDCWGPANHIFALGSWQPGPHSWTGLWVNSCHNRSNRAVRNCSCGRVLLFRNIDCRVCCGSYSLSVAPRAVVFPLQPIVMNESETHTEPVPGSHRIRWCLLFAIAIGACTFVAYFRAFSTFAEYDDEGYVMVSLQQHLKGGALFDDVYSQYGPAWYAIQSTFHRAFSLPVTHDITRFKTIVVWVLASSLAAFVVWNLTKCRTISLGSLLLAFLHLDRLVLEPGHPQELALLCVLAVLAIGTHRNSSVRGLWLLVMSAVVAVAVMTLSLIHI